MATQEQTDKDRLKHTGLKTNKANEGMRCRWSEVGKGQVKGKTIEGEKTEEDWRKGKRQHKTRTRLLNMKMTGP